MRTPVRELLGPPLQRGLDLIRIFRRPLVVLGHLVLIPVGYYAAFLLRFDMAIPPAAAAVFWDTVLWMIVLRTVAFGAAGLFHGWWRHAGIRDLSNLAKAVTASSLMFLVWAYVVAPIDGLPRSILLLDWGIAIILFGGIRFSVRAFRERGVLWVRRSGAPRALIVGAGSAAERLLRELHRDPTEPIFPVGLVDDDPSKRGMRIHGATVLGTTADIARLTARYRAGMVVIAIPSASREEMRAIIDPCIDTGLDFKIVPSLREVIDGRARMGELRNVEVEDLLGRDVVHLDVTGTETDVRGAVILVTGAAGSIGSELVRQLARLQPRHLVLFDQAESPLYFTHLELLRLHPRLRISVVVGDITNESHVDRVFQEHRPEVIFHAAAYKHVPLMEENPVEAVRNNVFGTLTVAECASRFGARRFVLISTDKAVRPSSIMGATKRIAEQIVLGWPSLTASGTDFRAVRFGNVLGSEGSVIPLFRRQMAAGQPLTVTHPEVTRYFMTIPEAAQLVLQAAGLKDAAGRISMLEMGEPVRIADLAEKLIRLSGMEPYRDVSIVFTGLRPGEKLHEELMSDLETTVATEVKKIRIVQTSNPDADALQSGMDRLAASMGIGLRTDVIDALCGLVPECVPPLCRRPTKPLVAVGE
jgi:FlaA1/EpsC-like NDP-sugar epimerase